MTKNRIIRYAANTALLAVLAAAGIGVYQLGTAPSEEKIIQEETEHLADLIKNLFELAKIDHNEFAITKERVVFSTLIETVLARIHPALNEKK